jgi:hypothetical protein
MKLSGEGSSAVEQSTIAVGSSGPILTETLSQVNVTHSGSGQPE